MAMGLRLLLALLLLGGLSGPAAALAAKETIKLAPHRAVYQMTLDDARSASGITGIDGRMVFEFSGSECDGYTLNMRMVTQMTDTQGQTNLTDLRSSTWEQANGQKFRFQSAQYLNDKLGDVTMGRAVRATPDTAVQVKLSQPSPAELNLSGQVLFPTQHSFALIDAAREGQRMFQAQIYDGSEKGQRVYDTTAFIGKPVAPGTDQKLEAPAKENGLAELVSWPVSIGYFEFEGRRSNAELSDRFPPVCQWRQPRAAHRLWRFLGPWHADLA